MKLSDLEGYADGTYLFDGESVTNYAEKWSYGYIVGTRSLQEDDLQARTLFGVRTDDKGQRVYDKVVHVDSRSDAMELAALFRQDAIWDLRGEHVLYV